MFTHKLESADDLYVKREGFLKVTVDTFTSELLVSLKWC